MSILEELRPPGGWYRREAGPPPAKAPTRRRSRHDQLGGLYDPAPILALFHGAVDEEVADRLGVSLSAVQRWRTGTRRIRAQTADELAIHIGLHPVLIWPEWEVATGDDVSQARVPISPVKVEQ